MKSSFFVIEKKIIYFKFKYCFVYIYIYHVDITDPSRATTPKQSALYYKQIVSDNGFGDDGQSNGVGKVKSGMFWVLIMVFATVFGRYF